MHTCTCTYTEWKRARTGERIETKTETKRKRDRQRQTKRDWGRAERIGTEGKTLILLPAVLGLVFLSGLMSSGNKERINSL